MEICYDCQDNCIDPKLCSCKCHLEAQEEEKQCPKGRHGIYYSNLGCPSCKIENPAPAQEEKYCVEDPQYGKDELKRLHFYCTNCGKEILRDKQICSPAPASEEKIKDKAFFADLERVLDQEFPKGECKERGAALVLFAYANMYHNGIFPNPPIDAERNCLKDSPHPAPKGDIEVFAKLVSAMTKHIEAEEKNVQDWSYEIGHFAILAEIILKELIAEREKEAEEKGYAAGFNSRHNEIKKSYEEGLKTATSGRKMYQLGFKDATLSAYKVVEEWLEAKIKSLTGNSTHGNCCTCQKCHQDHDDCTCKQIEFISSLQSFLKDKTK